MLNIDSNILKTFYKDSETGRYIFLFRNPFSESEIILKNKNNYNIFIYEEIYDHGILIGYSFNFKEKDLVSSKNILIYSKDCNVSTGCNILFVNKHIIIIESDISQSILIIGSEEGGN